MLILAQVAKTLSYFSWAVFYGPEMLAGEEAVPHHICHDKKKRKTQVVILECFFNSYYFGEINQVTLTDYFKQHIHNIQWKKYNSSNIFHFFRKK